MTSIYFHDVTVPHVTNHHASASYLLHHVSMCKEAHSNALTIGRRMRKMGGHPLGGVCRYVLASHQTIRHCLFHYSARFTAHFLLF